MIGSEITTSGKLQSGAAEISARVPPSVGTSFGCLQYENVRLRVEKGVGEEQGGAGWGMGTPLGKPKPSLASQWSVWPARALGWAGPGRRPAGRRARGRGAARKPGHIKERAARRGRLFPGWGL